LSGLKFCRAYLTKGGISGQIKDSHTKEAIHKTLEKKKRKSIEGGGSLQNWDRRTV